jgi:predicted GH43/DUF377 family glycosyl hydrolase
MMSLLTSLCARDFNFNDDQNGIDKSIVISTKQIILEDFPGAHNPSIIKVEDGYLMTFRFSPDPYYQPWVSYIGIVLLNESFEPISQPQLMNARIKNNKTPSQSEDARIFGYRGRIFVTYNDNMDVAASVWERRDIYIAEVLQNNHQYSLSTPLKLVYEEKYNSVLWQKNWIPFEWNKTLLISYFLNPHEVLYANLFNGTCYHCYETAPVLPWNFGAIRGSTPPLKIDGEYLAFFHSAVVLKSEYSNNQELWHYFTGAYTFSPEPPFNITQITPHPLFAEDFYNNSTHWCKRVVFPGGFVDAGSSFFMAYGKDDCEIWIAEIDKAALKSALKPVDQK